MKPGDTISLKRAPTNFGSVEFLWKTVDNKHASLDLSTNFRTPPKRIVLHAPWFLTLTEVNADGKQLKSGADIVLPASARHVELSFTRNPNAPMLNYASAVEQFKKDFKSHYEEFLKTGKN
jgi:hypothetical protein